MASTALQRYKVALDEAKVKASAAAGRLREQGKKHGLHMVAAGFGGLAAGIYVPLKVYKDPADLKRREKQARARKYVGGAVVLLGWWRKSHLAMAAGAGCLVSEYLVQAHEKASNTTLQAADGLDAAAAAALRRHMTGKRYAQLPSGEVVELVEGVPATK